MPLVSYPLAFLGSSPANPTQGRYYRGAVFAEGGRPRYRYTIEQGSLPPGLHLARKSGDIIGTTHVTGTYTLTVEVTDSTKPVPLTATQTYSLDVAPHP
jgi:hypothetical protein